MSTALQDAVGETVVVLDGGLATELEARGHDLRGGLWSARLLLDDPAAITAVHAAYFAAGAQIATTASYQCSELSLRRAGLDGDHAAQLLGLSVRIAADARDESCPDGWVAGSVGAYGASLADGSEYTGDYGLGDHAETVAALRRFHRPRMEALLAAGADVLACETVPTLAEVEALATELADLGAPCWVSVTPVETPGGPRTRTGERLELVAEALADVSGLVAVGVNCCEPTLVTPALRTLGAAASLPGIAYPNSGELWNSAAHRWEGPATGGFDVRRWLDVGAGVVGGCCRVGPSAIDGVRDVVRAAYPGSRWA